MPVLEPVEEHPDHVKLAPVDHQPDFADSLQGNFGTASQQLLAQEAQRRGAISHVMEHFTLPGRLAQGVQPQTPGMMTEEDAFRLNQLQNEAQNWAPSQAMNMIGSGMPAAEKMALGAGGGAIKAYHGSPYDFEKFDVGKIGTGEGAQAYGHGLYFAEAEPTAASYRPGPVADVPHEYSPEVRSAIDAVANMADPASSLRNQIGIIQKNIGKATELRDKEMLGYSLHVRQRALEALESGKVAIKPRGKMYEVNINADPEHFLDWDKPLSEQSQPVKDKLSAIGFNLEKGGGDSQRTPATLLDAKRPEGAERFREAGIPGIKYLDQGSRNISDQVKSAQSGLDYWRGVGDPDKIAQAERVLAQAKKMDERGTSNYVVFHHDIVDILKKYGLAALVAGGAAHFKTTPVDHNPFAAQQ